MHVLVERPREQQLSRRGWWSMWGAVLGRRLVIGLGMLAVCGVESPGTWLACAWVGVSYALESGVLRRWEAVGIRVQVLLLGGTGVYALYSWFYSWFWMR